jgi:hypothetical protein
MTKSGMFLEAAVLPERGDNMIEVRLEARLPLL